MGKRSKYHLLTIQQLLERFEKLVRQDCRKPLNDSDLVTLASLKTEIILRYTPPDAVELPQTNYTPGPVHDPFRGVTEEQLMQWISDLTAESLKQGGDPDLIIRMYFELLKRDFEKLKPDPEYCGASDEDKVKYFPKYKELFEKYAVASKYLVCRGLFHHESLRLWLEKCKYFRQSNEARVMDKEEAQCHLQAIYARMLFERMNAGHYSAKDSKEIYEGTFKMLMQDYEDFTTEIEEAKLSIKQAEQENASSFLQDMVSRVDELTDEQQAELIGMMQQQLARQQYEKQVLPELAERLSGIEPPVLEAGYGQNTNGIHEAELKMKRKSKGEYSKKVIRV